MQDIWPIVQGGGGAEVERWDMWAKWIEPWLWKCLYEIVIEVPYLIVRWFTRDFWIYMEYASTYGF